MRITIVCRRAPPVGRQVNGLRGETNTLTKMQRRVDHDLAYITNQSLLLDLRILVRTVRTICRDRNAYKRATA